MLDSTKIVWGLAILAMLPGCQTPEPKQPAQPSARLLRVFYRVGDEYLYLDVDRPLAVTPAPSGAGAGAPGGLRHYEVAGLSPGTVVVLVDDGTPTVDSGLLTLRREALQSLREARRGPRRELEWYTAALAGFVGEGLEPAEIEQIRECLFTPARTEKIALALYQHAHLLDEKLVLPWRAEDNAAIRLVPLVRGARLGNQRDLAEIFRLALEYHSDLPLFGAALGNVFPVAHNPELYRDPPLSGGPAMATFIGRLHQGLARAAYHSGPVPGWSLTPEP